MLASWKESYDKPRQHIKKQRYITLPTKVHIVKIVFSTSYVRIWELDHKEGCSLIKLWYWRRLLRVPWTARRSNQSILKETTPEYSLKGPMLKLLLLLSCFSRVRLCDPVDCSTPGLPVHHQFPELTQTHVYWVGDVIQPSHPLSFPSPPAFYLSQHQGLFKWVSSSHQVAKVLELQLQYQSFQWIFRTDFL